MSEPRSWRLRGAPIIHDTIDNETIAINQLSGAYYSLEGPSALVWQLLAPGATHAQIVEELARRYVAPPGELERAAEELLAQLVTEELVVELPADAAGSLAAPGSSAAAGTSAQVDLPPVPAERPAFPGLRLQGYDDLATLLLADPIHEVDETGWPTPMARRG